MIVDEIIRYIKNGLTCQRNKCFFDNNKLPCIIITNNWTMFSTDHTETCFKRSMKTVVSVMSNRLKYDKYYLLGGTLESKEEANISRETARELRRARFELVLKEYEVLSSIAMSRSRTMLVNG